jgi:HK97 gp10 family phage protein
VARRNVSLKGVSELTMKLKSNANMKDVKHIVKQNTAELTQGAQRKAPVDTGNLRRSITMDLSDGGLTGKVKPTADYAPYLEYGTRFQSAQPVMRPAFNKQKAQFKSDMDKLVE